jgi:predicted protein tyrosine phosphatase
MVTMNLLEPESYNVALRVFDNICGEWLLSESDKEAFDVAKSPAGASLITMSRIFSIYKSLHIIFENHQQANEWVHKDSSAFHSAAIEVMQTAGGLEKVQKYLQTQVDLIGGEQRLFSEAGKILFICTANIQRSLTAEHYFKSLYPQITFKSAGVSAKECKRNGSTLCTVELLEWADQVFVFEQMHTDRIVEHTGQKFVDKIYNLDIEDRYQYMDEGLVIELQVRIKEFISKDANYSSS